MIEGRPLVLATLLLGSPALTCGWHGAKNPILELARVWSGEGPALKCERQSAGVSDIADRTNPQLCEWERTTSGAPVERIRAGVDLGGGPSLVMWERFARDDADAERVIDSLGAALERRGLHRHECGTSSEGGVQARDILWEGGELLVYLMHSARPDSLPRLIVLASDDAATMPRPTLCHLESAPDAMWPTERGSSPRALRAEMVLGVVDFQLTLDSVLSIVHYQTNAPAKDSASVRKTLTDRLARPNSMLGALHTGVVPRQTTRLVIRPCHTDSCPPLGQGLPLVSGDLEFTLRPGSTWAPIDRPRTSPPRTSSLDLRH